MRRGTPKVTEFREQWAKLRIVPDLKALPGRTHNHGWGLGPGEGRILGSPEGGCAKLSLSEGPPGKRQIEWQFSRTGGLHFERWRRGKRLHDCAQRVAVYPGRGRQH